MATERKVMRMCETRWFERDEIVRAVHVTTRASVELAWDDRLGVEENHVAAAARVLGRAPEFQTSKADGGFIFGVDPAND